MAEGGAAKRRQIRDKERAAYMKRLGVERVTQRCPQCYRIISREGWKSSYTHKCR